MSSSLFGKKGLPNQEDNIDKEQDLERMFKGSTLKLLYM